MKCNVKNANERLKDLKRHTAVSGLKRSPVFSAIKTNEWMKTENDPTRPKTKLKTHAAKPEKLKTTKNIGQPKPRN